jgi:hypothetical protein
MVEAESPGASAPSRADRTSEKSPVETPFRYSRNRATKEISKAAEISREEIPRAVAAREASSMEVDSKETAVDRMVTAPAI